MFSRVLNSRRSLRLLIASVLIVLTITGVIGSESSVQAAKRDTTPLRIMPLGDSITAAFTGHASYRYWLWKKLIKEQFNVDFVGSQYGVLGGPPLYSDFDQNHEGHYAFTVWDLLRTVGGCVSAYQPQVIRLHIGTNDIYQGHDNATTINVIGQIIDTIRQNDPNSTIVLAQGIPLANKLDEVRDFNRRIPELAKQKSTRNSPIIVANQFAGFDLNADSYDGIHPNQKGEQKMADRWFERLHDILYHEDDPKPEPAQLPSVPLVKLAPTFVPTKK